MISPSDSKNLDRNSGLAGLLTKSLPLSVWVGPEFQIPGCGGEGRGALAIQKPDLTGLATIRKAGCSGGYEVTGFLCGPHILPVVTRQRLEPASFG